MNTKQRVAKTQTRPAVLDDLQFSQFDEQDEETVMPLKEINL